jgi:hypothetical protein
MKYRMNKSELKKETLLLVFEKGLILDRKRGIYRT